MRPRSTADPFLLTETDDNDLTYFIDYHLVVIDRAIEELYTYLARKTREVRQVERLLKQSQLFNHRQLALLGYAMRHPEEGFTFRTHAESHGVTHETARNDLLPLAEKGLLHRTTLRGRHVFYPDPELSRLLEETS